jgi:hypothetical protein
MYVCMHAATAAATEAAGIIGSRHALRIKTDKDWGWEENMNRHRLGLGREYEQTQTGAGKRI